jgi:hypothetical protein
LNGAPLSNKYDDAIKLRQEGVPTVEVSRNPGFQVAPPIADTARPVWQEAIDAAGDFVELDYDRNGQPFKDGVGQLQAIFARLHTALATPIPIAAQVTWLGRMNHHVGGDDLLVPPAAPEYFVKKEQLIREFRLHCFAGKSIKAGQKMPRTETPHPWVRSYDGGWKISYEGFASTKAMRALAKRAVVALGLQFGAVDIGQKADNSLIILEVNRAPGMDPLTVASYAAAVQSWIESGDDDN